MNTIYQYYKDLCKCPGIKSPGSGQLGNNYYDYLLDYCVCSGSMIYLGMRDLDGNETTNYPVTVYNINEEEIGYAVNKAQYISVWNSDPDNQAVGVLSAGAGPFAFALKLNANQVPPPWVIGVADEVETGIYEQQYALEYE